ncbi:MAG: hypothetical protein R3B09_02525 [Nannocystaceae bacterium]
MSGDRKGAGGGSTDAEADDLDASRSLARDAAALPDLDAGGSSDRDTSPSPDRDASAPSAGRRPPLLLALALGAATTTLLSLGHRDVGYTRDEGIYFAASRAYGGWAATLAQRPGEALSAPVRDRAFAVNQEHPALMKLAGGVAARLVATPTVPSPGAQGGDPPTRGLAPLLPEGAAMRLPAQLLAGLGVALLTLAGAGLGGSWIAGVLAALWFIALPRVWFHAGLHCFDVPVAVMTLAVALAYRRALSSPRWGLALGPILGVAIAVKHNALFLPVLLGLHYLVCLGRAGALGRPRLWPALPFASMATLGPLTAFALWPWLWSDPIGRLAGYFAFHRQHSYYNTEYLGLNYNQPPLPLAYPFTLTWATVPTCLLLLAAIGLAIGLWRDLSPRTGSLRQDPKDRRWSAPLRPGEGMDGLLLALLALFPLALIALPTVPIFGGTKHWMTAYPFLALAAASAWGALWRAVTPASASAVGAPLRRRARVLLAPLLALALLLGPSIRSTIHAHPHGLEQYAPLIGGARGAADLGLLRGFWGHALTPLLPTMAGLGERPFDLHDLHELARVQYEREGRWPPGLRPAGTSRAQAALLFHERHMTTYEVQQWNALGTATPAAIVELDDVPLTSLTVRGVNQSDGDPPPADDRGP